LFLSLLLVGVSASGEISQIGYQTVWFTCAGALLIGVFAFFALFRETAPAGFTPVAGGSDTGSVVENSQLS
jgi:hypothetical protein